MKAKLLIVLFFSWFSLLNANTVSNLQGKLSVNSGALNYSVPLNLPVGIAGVQPKVSLSYNSNGANAYFGQGWNITGLSTISRCGSNMAFDGKKQSVKYDTSDNICMDGQRLVLVSGTKWGNNSEYKTKIDTYSKIIYKDGDFKVWTKAGDIKEYTLINKNWFITKISDRYENSVQYNYSSSQVEVYLKDITYANNKIELNYEEKKDDFYGFSTGTVIRLHRRVKSISIKSDSVTLRSYSLKYKTQESKLDKSILNSVTECSSGSCLEPIEFESTKQKFGLTKSTITLRSKTAVYIDFNGDSYLDMYDNNHIAFGKGDGSFGILKNINTNVFNNGIKFADFDGDGDIDILAQGFGSFRTFVNDGQGTFSLFNTYNLLYTPMSAIKLADFNLDGNVDLLINKTIYFRNSAGVFNKDKTLPLTATNENIFLLDMNNDGYTDIYEFTKGTHNIYFNDGNAVFSKKVYTQMPRESKNMKLVDLNGDGLIDIYQINDGNKDTIHFNTGSEFLTVVTSQHINIISKNMKFVDMNGDGIIDIYEVRSGDDKIWINDGKGAFSAFSDLVAVNSKSEEITFADLNADGMVDLLETGSVNKVWFNQSKAIKLTKITDSFKNTIKINYKHLNDSSVYTKHADAAYPTLDIQSAQQVVSAVVSVVSNGVKMKTSYKYEGLKVNLEGLGSLGFSKVITENSLSKIKTVNTFNQNYPYIGTTSKNMSYLQGELVSEVDHEYSSTYKNSTYQIQTPLQTSKSYVQKTEQIGHL